VSLLDDIREAADALTEPHLHRAEIREWTTSRNKRVRFHVTTQPGLLTQLYQSINPAGSTGGEPGARGIPASRPPLAVEALSTHDEISMRTLMWCRELRIPPRNSPESNIRALVGAAGTLDDDDLHRLRADLRQWQRWCLVQTGWEKVTMLRGTPCPILECGRVGTLRVNLTTKTAMCRGCGSSWSEDDGSIGVLAAHVEATTARQQAG
jgi:hypothetical protein